MTTQHTSDTRKPWRVVLPDDPHSEHKAMYEIWTAKNETPGSRNNYIIALGIQHEEEATLLAAAPELLEALRELKEWGIAYLGQNQISEDCLLGRLLKDADKAIDKAKGQ